jgi:hypothetical protein
MLFLNFFKSKKKEKIDQTDKKGAAQKKINKEKVAERKGELGEYKIDIQLAQLPKEYRYISDLLIKNPKAKSGYSQVDHVVITPYGLFVIETKNYQGTIYGGIDRKTWSVNGKFNMMNPFIQNYGHIQALKGLLNKKYDNLFYSMVSFTKRCTFKVDLELRKIASNDLIVYDIELTEFLSRKIAVLKIQMEKAPLNETEIMDIYSRFNEANILDEKIRELHISELKGEGTIKSEITEETASSCVECNKPVSEKVIEFCKSNKRFAGKIYCYEHQKMVQ